MFYFCSPGIEALRPTVAAKHGGVAWYAEPVAPVVPIERPRRRTDRPHHKRHDRRAQVDRAIVHSRVDRRRDASQNARRLASVARIKYRMDEHTNASITKARHFLAIGTGEKVDMRDAVLRGYAS